MEGNLTILFYLNGNNSRQGIAYSALRQLEFIGSTPSVNLVAQVSRNEKWYDSFTGDSHGSTRYKIEKDPALSKLSPREAARRTVTEIFHWKYPPYTKGITSPPVQQLGDADMADPATLKDSIVWAMKSYPSKRFMVVVLGPSEGPQNVTADHGSGKKMTAPQLKTAIDEASRVTGKKPDLVFLDGPGSANLETAYELKDSTAVLSGSEGVLGGMGAPLPAISFEMVRANDPKPLDPVMMARYIAMTSSMHPAAPLFTPSISAIDLSRMKELKDSLDNLLKEVKDQKVPREIVRSLMSSAQNFGIPEDPSGLPARKTVFSTMKDLGDFAQRLLDHPLNGSVQSPQKVKDAARKFLELLDEAVIAEAHPGVTYPKAQGISAYMPEHFGDRLKEFPYENLALARDSRYDEFLKEMAPSSLWGKLAGVVSSVRDRVDRPLRLLGTLARTDGYYQAFKTLFFTGDAASLAHLSAPVAGGISAIGGLLQTLHGIREIFYGIRNGRKDLLTNGIGDTTQGGAMVALGAALAAGAAGIALPLSLVVLAVPVGRRLHALYSAAKKEKEKQASPSGAPVP